MGFGAYIRLEGWLAATVGVTLCGLGLVEGHQPPADAAFGGVIMLLGTAVFMVVRHGAPLRQPGAWFTAKPIAAAMDVRPPCRRQRIVAWMIAESAALGLVAVGLSYLTGFWLTYMDLGVWAIAIGVIKLGPATTMIAECEARHGTTYRVAQRPLRGLVQLTGQE